MHIDNNTVELSWFPSNENDFSMYRIYRSEHSPVSLNSPPIWINSNQTINRYKDQSLKSGRTYHYKIVVYDNGGLFAESNEVSISF
jgi:fibronectin type 3 domain-containing protein